MNAKRQTRLKELAACAVATVLVTAATSACAQNEELVARGDYLVNGVAACGNCHTPRDPDGRFEFLEGMHLAGAYVIEEPEFIAYAPNITQDPETGIGNWTDDQIALAIREGRHPDGRTLGPPMAFPFYRGISDNDLAAIVAYLRTVPPVNNVVPRTEFRIPLPPEYGPPIDSVPDVPRDDILAYGAYLAGPLGHCTDCHTPLVEGQHDMSRVGLGGNVFPRPFNSNWAAVARNITPHPQLGIGNWTDEQIKRAITEGIRPDGSQMTPFMAYPMYARMTDEDLNAIIAYLRSLDPLP